MKERLIKNICIILIAIIGASIIIFIYGWQLAIGIILLIWANNIERSLNKKK